LVTGAGRGIGKAIAEAYGDAGACVCCVARTLNEIRSTVSNIERKGGRAIETVADVRDPAAVETAFAAADHAFGGIDILVINAGIDNTRGLVEHSDPTEWQATIETNLIGAYHCARAGIPYLKKRGAGKIITIGSGLGRKGFSGTSAYSVSKAGLWMLTRVLAQELAESNISVNEIIPGPVQTSMSPSVSNTGAPAAFPESEWLKLPNDVVPLALFLALQPERGPTAQSYSLMRRDV
jgi:3-oxoacyl-[acyl-carrier protein] reductase